MICNYADDNHLVNESNCIDTIKVSPEKDAHRASSWFDNNYMDANLEKFQCIYIDRFGRPPKSISVEGNTPSSDTIKVLGVTLDSSLQYDTHISMFCSKASFFYFFISIFISNIYLYRVDHSVRLFFHGALLQNKINIQKMTHTFIYTHK